MSSSDFAMYLTRSDYVSPYEDLYEGHTGMPASRLGHCHRSAGLDLVARALLRMQITRNHLDGWTRLAFSYELGKDCLWQSTPISKYY